MRKTCGGHGNHLSLDEFDPFALMLGKLQELVNR
jgi:hypothetical protein